MIADTVRSIAEGYFAPRASARRLLDAGHGLSTALLMLALGYVIEAIVVNLMPGAPVARSPGVHLLNAALQVGVFFLLSWMIHALGRASGGSGTLAGAQLVVGWHALVTSPLTPLSIGFATSLRMQQGGDAATAPQMQVSGGALLLAAIYVGVWFWLLANYVTELHGFRNVWGVLAVMVGITFVCAMLITAIFGGLAQ